MITRVVVRSGPSECEINLARACEAEVGRRVCSAKHDSNAHAVQPEDVLLRFDLDRVLRVAAYGSVRFRVTVSTGMMRSWGLLPPWTKVAPALPVANTAVSSRKSR